MDVIVSNATLNKRDSSGENDTNSYKAVESGF